MKKFFRKPRAGVVNWRNGYDHRHNFYGPRWSRYYIVIQFLHFYNTVLTKQICLDIVGLEAHMRYFTI